VIRVVFGAVVAALVAAGGASAHSAGGLERSPSGAHRRAGPTIALSNSMTFTDPVGDSGAKPDISGGSVRNDDAGMITFTVTFANRPALSTDDFVQIIIDADNALAEHTTAARDRLTATDLDVAEVRWHDIQINGVKCSTQTFRAMFRALPGLTVERAHHLYTVPDDTHWSGRRFLWHLPSGHMSPESALDLTDAVTLHHLNSSREPERRQRALDYYKARDAAILEPVGDWG
jgi:hypothetical protein